MATDNWVKLASFGTTFEAERAMAALETEGIPALLQSHAGSGLFGAGFQGPVPGGLQVMVRPPDLERAWTLIVDHGA
jgi:hypothetical protein